MTTSVNLGPPTASHNRDIFLGILVRPRWQQPPPPPSEECDSGCALQPTAMCSDAVRCSRGKGTPPRPCVAFPALSAMSSASKCTPLMRKHLRGGGMLRAVTCHKRGWALVTCHKRVACTRGRGGHQLPTHAWATHPTSQTHRVVGPAGGSTPERP